MHSRPTVHQGQQSEESKFADCTEASTEVLIQSVFGNLSSFSTEDKADAILRNFQTTA
jgi:hypothetical protein